MPEIDGEPVCALCGAPLPAPATYCSADCEEAATGDELEPPQRYGFGG
ncbi:hypothetical protein [Actinopolyspora halophila]|nr:hypothetical protein [Actinopolyspora halophila]